MHYRLAEPTDPHAARVLRAFLAFVCNLIRTFLLVYLGAEHGFQAIKNWHDGPWGDSKQQRG